MAAAEASLTNLLLRLVAVRPQLLADHASAYAELLGSDLGRLAAAWQRQALMNALALCGLAAGTVLAGVAAMFWATLPADPMRAPWVLLVVPLLPIALAVACRLSLRLQPSDRAFDDLRRQLHADGAMLREAAMS